MSKSSLWMIVASAVLAVSACKKDPPKDPSVGLGANNGGANNGVVQKPSEAAAAAPDKKAPEGCNSDFAQPIETNYTLTEKCSPYTLTNSNLDIDGFDLTIEPGVELRVAEGRQINVGYSKSSRLTAKGTAEKPIKFLAATRKEAGNWKGIALWTLSTGSTIENASVEYAGDENGGAIWVEGKDTTLKSVKIVGARNTALFVKSNDPQKEFSALDLTGTETKETVINTTLHGANALGAGIKFAPKQVIEIHGDVERETRLQALGVPYRVTSNINVQGEAGKSVSLIVDPGVTLEFAENMSISVGYDGARPGAFKAVGTAEKPILFTRYGEDLKNTPWSGIEFFAGARPAEFDYVTFEYAGAKDDAAIGFNAARGLGKVDHCTFRHLNGNGLVARETRERFGSFDNNTFEDVGQAAIELPTHLAHQLGATNKFAKDAFVAITDDTLVEDTTLAPLTVPYRQFKSLTIDAETQGKSVTLTVLAGTTVEFGGGSQLNVGYANTGKLAVSGTDPKPVTFKAVEGTWNGLELGDKGQLQIDGLVIEQTADDAPAVRVKAENQGEIKGLTFKNVKSGLRNCSKKMKATGVKGAPETKEGC